MEQQYILGRSWYHLPFLRGTTRAPAQARRAEMFRKQTFLYMDALYTDAFCLTGNQEEAADLVVEAYLRAFRKHDRFRRRRIVDRLRPPKVLAWLYWNLHAAFCDRIVVQARRVEMGTGCLREQGRPVLAVGTAATQATRLGSQQN